MRNQRGNRAALVVATALTLAIGACGDGSATSPPAAAPADPKAALVAATAGLRAGNYTFTTSGHEDETKGVVHLPSRSALLDSTLKGEEAGTMQVLLVDPDRYIKMKMDLGEATGELDDLEDLPQTPQLKKLVAQLKRMREMFNGKTWLHVDMDKVKDDDLKLDLDNPDVIGATGLLGTVLAAQRQADGTITGTLDAAKAVKVESPITSDDLTKKPAELEDLPFVATLDSAGRLVKLVVDVPAAGAAPAHKRSIEITGYGTATAQHKPAGDKVMEMPADSYKMLNQ